MQKKLHEARREYIKYRFCTSMLFLLYTMLTNLLQTLHRVSKQLENEEQEDRGEKIRR